MPNPGPTPPPLLTQRGSAAVLGQRGVARRQARDLLGAGFAGGPMRVGNVCLYDRDAVEDLASWPALALPELDELCPAGVFIGRGVSGTLDLSADHDDQLAAVSDGWQLSPWTWLWLRFRIAKHGTFPFIATVAGFVALGADITGTDDAADNTTSLDLVEPGRWFEGVRRRRLRTGPGRAWVIRGLAAPRDPRRP